MAIEDIVIGAKAGSCAVVGKITIVDSTAIVTNQAILDFPQMINIAYPLLWKKPTLYHEARMKFHDRALPYAIVPKDEKNYRKQQVSSFRIVCQLSRQQENYLYLQDPKQVKNDFRKETSIKNRHPVQITHCPRMTDISGQTLVTTMEITEAEEEEGEEREAVGVAGGTTTVMVEAEAVALERGTRGLTALLGLLGVLEEEHGMS